MPSFIHSFIHSYLCRTLVQVNDFIHSFMSYSDACSSESVALYYYLLLLLSGA